MNIEALTSFLKILSWRKIIQSVIALLILGVAYGFWENRVTIYNSINVTAQVTTEEPLVIVLSSTTQQMLETTVNKGKGSIAGIQIVSVDFKKNSRVTSYFSISDETLKREFTKFLENRVSATPLFTGNEKNNQRMIDLINGEFSCSPFKDTIAQSLMPRVGDTISSICSISIPPYYGRFSGYMNVYLYKEPSVADMSFTRQLIRDLSLKVYETDIDKSPKYRN